MIHIELNIASRLSFISNSDLGSFRVAIFDTLFIATPLLEGQTNDIIGICATVQFLGLKIKEDKWAGDLKAFTVIAKLKCAKAEMKNKIDSHLVTVFRC